MGENNPEIRLRQSTSLPLFEQDAPERERSKGRAIPSGTFSAISQTSSVDESRDDSTGIPGCALSAEAPAMNAAEGEGSRPLSFEQAHARRTDPQHSHDAARSVVNLGRTREAILDILRRLGPLSDEGIADRYELDMLHGRFEPCSPSGLRSRRSELVRMGFVCDSGLTGKTAAGRACTIWKLADDSGESFMEMARRLR